MKDDGVDNDERWYAVPNDLIGGWCVSTENAPPSQSDVMPVADFMDENVARYVAALHNNELDRMG